MLAVAVTYKLSCYRMSSKINDLQSSLQEAEMEKERLNAELAHASLRVGIGHESVMALAGEITRMENNLNYMGSVLGSKQLQRCVERMKMALKAEDYTIVPLLGFPYEEGMNVKAVFVTDVNLPKGRSIIISVQKPQVNRGGKMIQAAHVTVGQNI